jgi:hypothetical protein
VATRFYSPVSRKCPATTVARSRPPCSVSVSGQPRGLPSSGYLHRQSAHRRSSAFALWPRAEVDLRLDRRQSRHPGLFVLTHRSDGVSRRAPQLRERQRFLAQTR